MITPDWSYRETIQPLLSRLISYESSDFPVQAPGFVRTFLYPAFFYSLAEERLEALCEHSLARAVPTFYVKLLRGSPFVLQWEGEIEPGNVIPPDPGEAAWDPTTPDEVLAHQGWSRRLEDLWWQGTWSSGEAREDRFQAQDAADDPGEEPLLLEHALLDGAGAWAIVFSDEDHAFLVSEVSTSREILDAWGTTPAKELAEYESQLRRISEHRELGIERRILAHARAGVWG